MKIERVTKRQKRNVKPRTDVEQPESEDSSSEHGNISDNEMSRSSSDESSEEKIIALIDSEDNSSSSSSSV